MQRQRPGPRIAGDAHFKRNLAFAEKRDQTRILHGLSAVADALGADKKGGIAGCNVPDLPLRPALRSAKAKKLVRGELRHLTFCA
jgi:hypothetical protein